MHELVRAYVNSTNPSEHQIKSFDDFIENLEAASALGMHTVHFRNRTQAQQQVESLLAWHPTQHPS